MDTRRDFIYIQDLIDVVMIALNGENCTGAYHVSSGKDFSIKELFDATIQALSITLDEEVEIRPRGGEDAYTILLDPSKTEQDLVWKVTTSLEVGVKAAVEYYKMYGITETYTHLKIGDNKH